MGETDRQSRWEDNWVCVGVGVLCGVDLALLSFTSRHNFAKWGKPGVCYCFLFPVLDQEGVFGLDVGLRDRTHKWLGVVTRKSTA